MFHRREMLMSCTMFLTAQGYLQIAVFLAKMQFRIQCGVQCDFYCLYIEVFVYLVRTDLSISVQAIRAIGVN